MIPVLSPRAPTVITVYSLVKEALDLTLVLPRLSLISIQNSEFLYITEISVFSIGAVQQKNTTDFPAFPDLSP